METTFHFQDVSERQAHQAKHYDCERGRCRRAFTVIEILVALGITAFITAFIVAIVSNVSGFWSRTSGRLSAEAQARFVIDQLALDLSSAQFRDDGNTWLAVTILSGTNNAGNLWNTTGTTPVSLKPSNANGSLQGIVSGNLADARFGIAGAWLRFFTVKRGSNTTTNLNTTAATTSAPVAVSYQIIRRATSGSEARSSDRRYLLHRSEVRPAALSAQRPGTLESGYDITAPAYAPGRNTAQVQDPAEIRYPTIDSVIAENVIDFGVRLYVRDPATTTGLRLVFPTTNTMLVYTAATPSGVSAATNSFPDVVDVMVRVLTDEGARLIAGYEANPQRVTNPQGRTAQQYWWDLALAHSQVFTRRIIINANPL